MNAPKLGTITIGQVPRPDVAPVIEAQVPAGVDVVHVGVLDRLSDADIAAQFGPRPREARMLTRLATGRAVEVDATAIEAGLQRRLVELEDAGCTVVTVLCTGVFRRLRTRRAWLIEPDRILPALVGGLVGARKVGIIGPLATPLDAFRRKWSALQVPPTPAVASPYDEDDAVVTAAAREAQRGGAEALLLDCIGYGPRHREAARRATGLAVLQASDLVARVTGACLAEPLR
jgi:protein AroM